MKTIDIEKLVRDNVLQMKPYASARDEFKTQTKEMIFLDANENPFENGLNRYPDSQQQNLKDAIARLKNVKTSQLTLGNGSDEILDLIFRTFCTPAKDNIVTLPPTYGMYEVLANLNNIENREVFLTADFQPDNSRIVSKIDQNTKLIFICSPNNPTGNSISTEKITWLLENGNCIVVLDEAYIDFSNRESWLKRLGDYPNLIIVQTFSKAYGLAGIRLGVAFASPEITALLNKIKPPYNVNTLTQNRALDFLNSVKKEITLIKEEKKVLIKVLLQVNFIVKVYDSEANFLLIKVDDALKRYHQLLENGIVVRNRSSYPLCENCLRITIGTKEENKQLIQVVNQIANTQI